MASLWQSAERYFFSGSGWPVVLEWWLWLLVPGLLALPLTARLSARQFDGAYPLAKVLGLVLPAYAVWLLSSLHVAPFARATLFAAVGALALAAIFLFRKDRGALREARIWRTVMLEEALFLAVLTGFGLLRFIRPELTDIEKYMNFAFLNASLRTETMPPIDPWYALEPMNYYYFGHYLAAYQIKLGGFAPAFGYNLMFATLPALAFVLTFSIAANATVFLRRETAAAIPAAPPPRKGKRTAAKESSVSGILSSPRAPVAAGLVSAVLLVFGGSLHAFVYGVVQPAVGARAHPPNLAIFSGGMKEPRPYIWSDPRSYVGYNPDTDDKTITEFPAYAFVLGDLHAHVIDLVLVLSLLLILLLGACRSDASEVPFVLLVGVMLGLFALTNTWDVPIYSGLAAIVFLLRFLRERGSWSRSILPAAIRCLVMGAIALAVAWPFLRHFHPSAKQISFATRHTPLWQLAILWGEPVVLMTLFTVFLGRWWRNGRSEGRRLPSADVFVLACLLVAAGCIALPEVLYFKDIFEERWPRAITMFKFSFQAYALTAVASGYIALRLLGWIRAAGMRWLAGAGLLVWMGLALEFFDLAVPGYYLSQPSVPQTLDGLAYLRVQHPEDAAIVDFLEREAGPGNILESTGEPYAHSGRISVATGRPTVMGWWLHERLWRNEPGADPVEERRRAVLEIYGPGDPARARRLLQRYAVRYIVLAPEERREMPNLDEKKLRTLARSVFRSGAGEVLEVLPGP